jgi:hypothetical protein
MLMKEPRQLITYKKIKIYEQSYQLPIFQNARLKRFQKKIKERRRLIQEGIRYYYYFGKLLKRKERVSQQEIFIETQLLVKDYGILINGLETYQDNYYNFLLILSGNLKQLFTQKYRELKILDYERVKLEIKNNNNQKILHELKREKQENFRAILLLGQTSFLMLEKTKLLSQGVKKLAEDTQKQKQIVQRIIKELEVYQELNEYQAKAQKVRQEIAELAQNAMDFENSLQDYFAPFQSLIDEVIKVDEEFYATVGEIKYLIDNICQPQPGELNSKDSEDISEFFLNFMVSSYEKGERLKYAFLDSQLSDEQSNSWEFSNQFASLEQTINKLSNYLSDQLENQRELLPIKSVNIVSKNADFIQVQKSQKQQKKSKISEDLPIPKYQDNSDIDYTKLRNLLSGYEWKAADIETTTLLLKVMGKNYWNEVYQEDINNFSCQELKIIDQLWLQHSNGHFGFSIQQSIWSAIGGQIDYETDKKLGNCLGWRREENWLRYEQLTFELSATTPMGHLPANWLNYDQQIADLLPTSGEINSVGAWRVSSWLLWQMHLFLSRVKVCELTPLSDFSC